MKKILFIITLFVSVFCSQAQELEDSLLWEITGKGLENPSYIFGTIHVTCDAALSDKVKTALDNTAQLVLEIDIDDPQMQMKMMKGMRMKEGKMLKDFLNEKELADVDSLFLKNMGMSINMLQTVKPMMLNSMLIPKLMDCPIQSFEAELVKVAKEQKEEIKGLETIEYQLKMFDLIPYEDQAKELAKSAKDNLAKSKADLAKLVELYNQEKITGMLALMNEDQDNVMIKYQDQMFDTRNKNWIPEISKYAKEKSTFFGVGAGHLPGENGVINLLRKEGYTVKAVQK
jgi:uncharacterized protein YbaP (TraB family)